MTHADLEAQSSPDRRSSILQASAWRTGFIASPAYDLAFFVLSPLLALAIILALDTTDSGWAMREGNYFGQDARLLPFFIGTWTFAHLFAVVFRSHANPVVFKRFWPRFVIVPILLFVMILTDDFVLVFCAVLVFFWDVYHTSMQNFGFCRIYDSKLGNPPEQGRRLDIWMNHLVYIGPIFIGVNFGEHLDYLKNLEQLGWNTSAVVEPLLSVQDSIVTGLVTVGAFFVAYYVYAYWQMSRQGYRVAPQKVLLLVSTAVGCIWAWGFLPPLQAFFTANFFHGLQYFAIVWWSEKSTLSETLHLSRVGAGRALTFVLFLLVVGSFGIWYQVVPPNGARWAQSIAIVVSLMHFWYDSFIWSVRKGQV